MREIKFRLWAEGEDAATGRKYMTLFDHDFIKDWKLEDILDWQPKSVVMQFTGLYDKNGNEIWEGDLMDFDGEILEVRWDEDRMTFELWDRDDWWSANTLRDTPRLRIIGNIYEDPELMKD